MVCPECGSKTYTAMGGFEICPACGHGSPSTTAAKAADSRAFAAYVRSIAESPGDVVLQSGAWVLKIVYKARGSKSEGQHGILCHNGAPVSPQHIGEVIETDLGFMQYFDDLKSGQPHWVLTGWNFADPSLRPPSWVEV